MAIPISEYISIQERAVNATGIELNALLITGSAMREDETTYKTDYDAGKVIALSGSEALAAFEGVSAAVNTRAILTAYGDKKILLKKKIETSFKAALQESENQNGSFGAFVVDTESELVDIAEYNGNRGAQHLFIAADDEDYRGADNLTNPYLLKVNIIKEDNTKDFGQLGAVLRWAVGINHTAVNGASSLMYKDLGVYATVETLGKKQAFDAVNVNYCGLVQTHGATKKFFQMGKCADGMDAGVAMSSIYLTAYIENAWIAFAMGASKIPANDAGAAMVLGIVSDAANIGVRNGAILCDKPLTEAQQRLIYTYTGDASSVASVMSSGYFIDANIVTGGNGTYICQYILVYAKGDNIAKVGGSHVLV